jgi:8-oxo-dGTP diphosphatase
MSDLPDGEELSLVSVHTGPAVVTTIVVTAALIERDGRFLVTRRQAGAHLAGSWEFPGGKCEVGESLSACMARELREELAIDASVGEEIFTTTHDYPDRRLMLHFFRCESHDEPSSVLGQEMRWVANEELDQLEFPPADAELIRLLIGSCRGRS